MNLSHTPSLLRQTPLLEHHPRIRALVAHRGWLALTERERIASIYRFVRDEIAFGYNLADDLPASRVLADGIGQCNTKGSLFMALLRACGIPCWLHGFILDSAYLRALQQRFTTHQGAFCGYAAATPDLHHPPVDWQGGNTYIQKDGINHDFGVFEDPDAFYARHGSNLTGVKRWLFQAVVRRWMNHNVARIRAGE